MVMIGEKLWGAKLLGPVSYREISAYQRADSFAAKANTFAVLWLESVAFVFVLVRKLFRHVCFGAKAFYS